MKIYNENVKDFVKVEMSKLGLDLIEIKMVNKVVVEMVYESDSYAESYRVKFTKEDIDKIEDELSDHNNIRAQLIIVNVLAKADWNNSNDYENYFYADKYKHEIMQKLPMSEKVLNVLYSHLPEGIIIADDTRYAFFGLGDIELESEVVRRFYVTITNAELLQIEKRLCLKRDANEYVIELISNKIMNHPKYARHMINMGY